MSGSVEIWMGELPVSAKLVMGSELLSLLFTNTRVLVVHAGKRGRGAVTGTAVLGELGGALEGLFKGRQETKSKDHNPNLTPNQVLRAHKDSFAIDYKEVISVNVRQTDLLPSITILTGGDKFEFSSRSKFEEIVKVFKNTLANKLTVQRLT